MKLHFFKKNEENVSKTKLTESIQGRSNQPIIAVADSVYQWVRFDSTRRIHGAVIRISSSRKK